MNTANTLPCTILKNADGSLSLVGMTKEFANELLTCAANGSMIVERQMAIENGADFAPVDTDRFAFLRQALPGDFQVIEGAQTGVAYASLSEDAAVLLVEYALSGIPNDGSDHYERLVEQLEALGDVLRGPVEVQPVPPAPMTPAQSAKLAEIIALARAKRVNVVIINHEDKSPLSDYLALRVDADDFLNIDLETLDL